VVPADLLTAIQSRKDWRNQSHIASELGVSQASVSRALSSAGVKLELGRTVNKAGEGLGDQDDVYSSRSPVPRHGNGHSWVSLACKEPAARQAEILPSDRGHRHPYSGSRPEWSGYCTVPCDCSCHSRLTSESP
jgi:hypothetical protein